MLLTCCERVANVQPNGGKVVCVLGSPPTVGIGKVNRLDNPGAIGSDQEKKVRGLVVVGFVGLGSGWVRGLAQPSSPALSPHECRAPYTRC